MANRSQVCGCGKKAEVWGRDGTGYCRDCARAQIQAQLDRGETVTIAVGGKPRWTFTPHLDQNGQLAIVFGADSLTGEMTLGTYPAG
jgi:hypothetical protein